MITSGCVVFLPVSVIISSLCSSVTRVVNTSVKHKIRVDRQGYWDEHLRLCKQSLTVTGGTQQVNS